jgi:hypothetical protein
LVKPFGYSDLEIKVQLVSQDEQGQEAVRLDDEQTVVMSQEGQAIPVEFETTESVLGRREFSKFECPR